MCGHILECDTQRRVSVAVFACECLGQLIAGELAESAQSDDLVEDLEVGIVGLPIETSSTFGESLHLHLIILEVRLLENDSGAIGELEFLEAKHLILCLLDDFSGFGQLCDKRLVFDIVDISLHGLTAHSLYGLLHLVDGRIHLPLLLLCPCHHDKIGVGEMYQFRHHHIDHLHGQVGHNLVHGLVE